MSSDTTVWTAPSPERMSIADTATALTDAMATAFRLFNSTSEQDLLVDMWTQCWPTSACGFNASNLPKVEQWLTVSTVIVVRTKLSEQVVVFIAGRFAYHVKNPSPIFYAAYAGRSLAGESDWKKVSRYESTPL